MTAAYLPIVAILVAGMASLARGMHLGQLGVEVRGPGSSHVVVDDDGQARLRGVPEAVGARSDLPTGGDVREVLPAMASLLERHGGVRNHDMEREEVRREFVWLWNNFQMEGANATVTQVETLTARQRAQEEKCFVNITIGDIIVVQACPQMPGEGEVFVLRLLFKLTCRDVWCGGNMSNAAVEKRWEHLWAWKTSELESFKSPAKFKIRGTMGVVAAFKMFDHPGCSVRIKGKLVWGAVKVAGAGEMDESHCITDKLFPRGMVKQLNCAYRGFLLKRMAAAMRAASGSTSAPEGGAWAGLTRDLKNVTDEVLPSLISVAQSVNYQCSERRDCKVLVQRDLLVLPAITQLANMIGPALPAFQSFGELFCLSDLDDYDWSSTQEAKGTDLLQLGASEAAADQEMRDLEGSPDELPQESTTSPSTMWRLGSKGASCEETCEKEEALCSPAYAGFNREQFRRQVMGKFGIKCDFKAKGWSSHDQPSFSQDRTDTENYMHCLGTESIPDFVNCQARGRDLHRWCRCEKTCTSPTTQWVLGKEDQSCNGACLNQGAFCNSRIADCFNSEDFTSAVEAAEKKTCVLGQRPWRGAQQPSFLKTSMEATYEPTCDGVANIPATVKCSASSPGRMRWCRCQRLYTFEKNTRLFLGESGESCTAKCERDGYSCSQLISSTFVREDFAWAVGLSTNKSCSWSASQWASPEEPSFDHVTNQCAGVRDIPEFLRCSARKDSRSRWCRCEKELYSDAAQDAPFNAIGFGNITDLRSKPAMRTFIRRYVKHEAGTIGTDYELGDLVARTAFNSFDQLVAVLQQKKWVAPTTPAPEESAEEKESEEDEDGKDQAEDAFLQTDDSKPHPLDKEDGEEKQGEQVESDQVDVLSRLVQEERDAPTQPAAVDNPFSDVTIVAEIIQPKAEDGSCNGKGLAFNFRGQVRLISTCCDGTTIYKFKTNNQGEDLLSFADAQLVWDKLQEIRASGLLETDDSKPHPLDKKRLEALVKTGSLSIVKSMDLAVSNTSRFKFNMVCEEEYMGPFCQMLQSELGVVIQRKNGGGSEIIGVQLGGGPVRPGELVQSVCRTTATSEVLTFAELASNNGTEWAQAGDQTPPDSSTRGKFLTEPTNDTNMTSLGDIVNSLNWTGRATRPGLSALMVGGALEALNQHLKAGVAHGPEHGSRAFTVDPAAKTETARGSHIRRETEP